MFALTCKAHVCVQENTLSTKVMQLIDARSGLMRCTVCDALHFASLSEGGHFQRGAWQCVNGCTPLATKRQLMKVRKLGELMKLGELAWARQILAEYGGERSAKGQA